MAIYMTATFEVHPTGLDEAKRAIAAFVDYVRLMEPNTRLYTSLQAQDNPHRFLHYFIFENEAAMAIHRTSEGVKHFTDALYPLLVDGVTFTQYSSFTSTDR